MALARARQAARRVKDRWKSKQWYKVVAPVAFSSKVVGETMADDAAKLLGRTVESTLHELTGDMKLMHVKLTFQVNEVVDNQARTTFVGHEMTSDYVRRLTRRGHTKIPHVFDVKTKDGSRVRVKPFAVSDRRCQTTQAQAIRQVMQQTIEQAAAENTLNGFLKEVLLGDLTTKVYKEARKIHPLRRIEVAKTEVVKAPTIEVDETPIIQERQERPEAEDAESEGVELGDEDEVLAEGDSEDGEGDAGEDAKAGSEEE